MADLPKKNTEYPVRLTTGNWMTIFPMIARTRVSDTKMAATQKPISKRRKVRQRTLAVTLALTGRIWTRRRRRRGRIVAGMMAIQDAKATIRGMDQRTEFPPWGKGGGGAQAGTADWIT